MTSTIILAGSFQEASRYAAAKGLRNWRRVASTENLMGLRPERAIILPGFERSPAFGLRGSLDRLVRAHDTAIIHDQLPAAPPVPSYGEPGYVADPLLGDVDMNMNIDFAGAQEPILATPAENQAAALAATKRVRKTRAAARKPAADATELDELFD